jgi:hypothetical protein
MNMKTIRIFLLALLVLFAFTSKSQHYIGKHKGDIISNYAYDHSVQKMSMKEETVQDVSMEVLSYYFYQHTYYYYLNINSGICETFAALFDSPTAKDSLIRVYDSRYKRMPVQQDTASIAWIEYGDGINYKRILRDFKPPTCLVILAIIKRIED